MAPVPSSSPSASSRLRPLARWKALRRAGPPSLAVTRPAAATGASASPRGTKRSVATSSSAPPRSRRPRAASVSAVAAKRRGGSPSRRATATRPSTTSRWSTTTGRPPRGGRTSGGASPSTTARRRGAVRVTCFRRTTPCTSASGAYTISRRGTCTTVRPPAPRRRSSSTSEWPSVPPTPASVTRSPVADSSTRTTARRSSARTAPVRLVTASAAATSAPATSPRASQRRSRRILERLPHAQVELPARVAARRLEREAQVDAQWPDRALVAEPEAEAVAQVVEREVEARERHLPRVGEHGRAEPLGHGVAELGRALDQRAAADRVVVDERPDVPALVAAHRADAAGGEALEERAVTAPAGGLLGAQAEPERRHQVREERLVAPPLALEAHEGELAAEETPHGLDAGARHPAACRVEEVVGPVPVGAEPQAGEEAGVRRDVREPAGDHPVHVRERVVLEAVEEVGREGGERLERDARREGRAVVGVGLPVLLVLGGDQAAGAVPAG